MYLLHIEHSVPDYEAWRRNGFDSDPLGRQKMGVLRHRVGRRTDDLNHVMIDLEFATSEDAERMAAALKQMWVGAEARGLIRTPELTSFTLVDSVEY
ncbi:hypothetical protein [Devosia sp. CN2-171]|jgi:hypothetical protein|uniref:hypothetical protein n=1 Tax=Devosia sp. CN2-171 TaxID=3400909 RepID=UPI003BF86B88